MKIAEAGSFNFKNRMQKQSQKQKFCKKTDSVEFSMKKPQVPKKGLRAFFASLYKAKEETVEQNPADDVKKAYRIFQKTNDIEQTENFIKSTNGLNGLAPYMSDRMCAVKIIQAYAPDRVTNKYTDMWVIKGTGFSYDDSFFDLNWKEVQETDFDIDEFVENRPDELLEGKITKEKLSCDLKALKKSKKFKKVPLIDIFNIFKQYGFDYNKMLSSCYDTKSAALTAQLMCWNLLDTQDLKDIAMNDPREFEGQDDAEIFSRYTSNLLNIDASVELARKRAQELQTDDILLNLFVGGLSLGHIIAHRNFFQSEEFLKYRKYFTNPDYELTFKNFQNNYGFELLAQKSAQSVDNDDIECRVEKVAKINDHGEFCAYTTRLSTIPFVQDGKMFFKFREESYYQNPKREVISEYENNINSSFQYKNLKKQIEIVNDEDEKYILYTVQSPVLQGVYETTKYNLDYYPKDYDVLKAIEEGSISGGEKLSYAYERGRYTRFLDTKSFGNIESKRIYELTKDETDKPSEIEYIYQITDSGYRELLNVNRSWIRNGNSTTTIINGKRLDAEFDDDNFTVTITDDKGHKTLIDIKEKLNRAKQNPQSYPEFFEFIKTVPANLLLDIETYVDKLFIKENPLASAYGGRELDIGCSIGILAHELGHAKDRSETKDTDKTNKAISTDKEIIALYKEEMEAFRKEYTKNVQDIIQYLGLEGGNEFNTGLDELVAETNMLINTHGVEYSEYQARSEYLVRFFPKTISAIAKIFLEQEN